MINFSHPEYGDEQRAADLAHEYLTLCKSGRTINLTDFFEARQIFDEWTRDTIAYLVNLPH